jgi:hypothetical protein
MLLRDVSWLSTDHKKLYHRNQALCVFKQDSLSSDVSGFCRAVPGLNLGWNIDCVFWIFVSFLCTSVNRGSSVDIATGYILLATIRSRIFNSPYRLHQHWVKTSLLSDNYSGSLFSAARRQGPPTSRKWGSIPPLLHTCGWHGVSLAKQWNNFTFTFASVPPDKYWDYTVHWLRPLPSTILLFYCLLSFNYATLYSLYESS